MLIQRLDPHRLARAYDIHCQGLYPWDGVVEPPFGAAWAVVAPGEKTKLHHHQDGETFFIAKGRGEMRVGDESAPVESGCVVYLPPFEEHTLINTSPDEDLLFLSVWWEDMAEWHRRLAIAPAARAARVMVTAAPPTPNGDLHLGHLSGPYLAADIHARYLRARGVEAHYVCGTDDNQSYVEAKAEQMGLPPQETADRMAEAIEATLRAARAQIDVFVRPNQSPRYASMVERFCRALYDAGELVTKETLCPYCEGCDRYLFEARIKGKCPHCGSATGGNSCEDCGRPNDCIDLVEPSCSRCGARPTARLFKRLFFPLGRWAEVLRAYHRTVLMSPRLRALCEEAIAAGLPDIAVSHVSDWGIHVPIEGFEGQRLYAWFEMAPRYLAYGDELGAALGEEGRAGEEGGWARRWKSDDARVVQCFGFDNGFFYAVFVPALLRAFDRDIHLASAFVMNEFYRLDGLKFSTSRRHAIWGREMLAAAPADLVRFYLAYTCPESEGTNFTLEAFAATVEREFIAPLQSWLVELGARVANEAGGRAPAPGDWTGEQRRFYGRLEAIVSEAASAYEASSFSPQRAARAIAELVREARRFGHAESHWARVASRREERRTALALELVAVKALAMIAAPLMPDFAARLFRALGDERSLKEQRWEDLPVWIEAGHAIEDLGAAASFPDLRASLRARFGAALSAHATKPE